MNPAAPPPVAPPAPRRRRLWRWLLGLLVVAAVAGGGLALHIARDGLRDRPGRADVGLVLGNAVEAGGKPSALLRERLDCALDHYRRGDYPLLIVSGGIDKIGGDEAAAMRNYLAAQGVPAERIISDSHGVNTYASARFTARLLRARGWRSVCVVTHYYHVPRARLALRRFGVGTVYSAHAGAPWEYDWRFHLVRETAGFVEYALRPYGDPTR